MRVLQKSLIFTAASAVAAFTCTFSSIASAAPIPAQYTIKSGDSFWKIAQQYQIPVSSLIMANPDEQIYNLQIGQILTLPGFGDSNNQSTEVSGTQQTGTTNANSGAQVSTSDASPKESQTSTTKSANVQDAYWMARVIHAEACGESMDAQIAVGDTVLHRMESSPKFKTVHDVVFDIENGHYQFTCVANGFINTEPTQSAITAANEVLNDHVDLVPGATVFYNPSQTPASSWVWTKQTIKTIGNLVFAK